MSIIDYRLTCNHTEKPIITIDWYMTIIMYRIILLFQITCIDMFIQLSNSILCVYVLVYGLYWLCWMMVYVTVLMFFHC